MASDDLTASNVVTASTSFKEKSALVAVGKKRATSSDSEKDDDNDCYLIAAAKSLAIGGSALPIPAALVKEQWRLIFTPDASIQDLQEAINHCKDLVLLMADNSEERKWLVRHLVDLRYTLKQMMEAEQESNQLGPTHKTIVGHHLIRQSHDMKFALNSALRRNYCDHCAGIIWSLIQTSYICINCHFQVHQKCMDHIVRVCAHVIVSERSKPLCDICPDAGLAAQRYRCAECNTPLNYPNSSGIEARLCDYTGLYYCPKCHWNDQSLIPARIIYNWDFSCRLVSRPALQEILLFVAKPLIKLEELNPKLFIYLEKLANIKKLRTKLMFMRKYLAECRQAIQEKFLDTQIGSKRYLIQTPELYSINDMELIESGQLADELDRIFIAFNTHIRNCEICLAKAYICEICHNNEVIFPFDDDCVPCDDCNSIYHRICFKRKNSICPKCIRLQRRLLQRQKSVCYTNLNESNSNSTDSSSDE